MERDAVFYPDLSFMTTSLQDAPILVFFIVSLQVHLVFQSLPLRLWPPEWVALLYMRKRRVLLLDYIVKNIARHSGFTWIREMIYGTTYKSAGRSPRYARLPSTEWMFLIKC